MSAFLVALFHPALGLLPAKLCASREDAQQFAATMNREPTEEMTIAAGTCFDSASVEVIEFKDGSPVACEQARVF